ncbi:MAG: ROK family protein [Acidobacteriaceae bacterium]
MMLLAVDLGGTHANCALVRDRSILRSRSISCRGSDGMATLLPSLSTVLRALAEEEGFQLSDLDGIAVGFCGLVDRREGRVTATSGKYEDAPQIDLPAWGRREFGLPLVVENDARMALLGEHFAGAAAGFDDVVMVTLGTGIGGAAMMGGRLLTGKHFQAGCLGGHIPAILDGATCSCGAIGCAESEAAGWCLPRVCRDWPGFAASRLAREAISFKTLFRCADAGDAVAQQVLGRCLRIWGANAVALIHAYDPELLVYGGGVMHSGDRIVQFVQDYVARHAWTPWGTVQVRAAKLGGNAALLGAIPLMAELGQGASDVR